MSYEKNPIDSKQKILRPDETAAELNTGKTWGLTNKTIYRKVLSTGTLPNASSTAVSVGVSNLETIIHMYGFVKSSNATFSHLPIPNVAALPSQSIQVFYRPTANQLVIRNRVNQNTYSGHIVIEYTKSS